MMKDRCKILLLIFCFQSILISSLYSQTDDLKFERITTEQGLASNTVFDILQDRYGFMWFGTNDGLCRYDGYNIKIYRYDPLDSNSISSSWASRLYEDRAGNIWIGTVRGGINKFDPATEKFVSYQHEEDDPHSLSDDTAFGICQDTSGTIWIGTWKGLDELVINSDVDSNNQRAKFIHYQNDPDNPNSLSDPRIWHIYIDQSNVIWIATQDGGLNKFDITTEQFTHYKHDPQNPHSISNNCVRYSYEDPEGDENILWIGTKSGLNKFNKTTEIFTRFQHNPDDSTSLTDNVVVRIRRANNGTLWIGTAKGLNKFIPPAKPDSSPPRFIHYQHDEANLSSLSHNFVYSIFEDRSGVLWLGTIGGGVNKISREQKKFLINNRLGGVTTLFEDSDGMIWSGTTNGLARYDPSENDVVRYQNILGNENSLLYNNVHFILEDPYYPEKTLWIACYGGGLDRLVEKDDGQSLQFTHFKHDPVDSLSINSECVDMLYFDDWGRMWIGTCEGLNLFNRSTETFTYFEHDPNNPYTLSSKWVTSICQTVADSNVLWVGTENGFNKFLISENIFIRYRHDPADPNSLAHDYIQAVHEDSYHQGKVVWIGTFGGGLDKFDSETEKFTRFTEEHGLINNTIASIVEDDSFNLWISTKKGVS
ncbi:histidine kinase, partial [candidate division KSB1 bacterium]|nr:histidine kinase [candidate division KSB1 bacterium]